MPPSRAVPPAAAPTAHRPAACAKQTLSQTAAAARRQRAAAAATAAQAAPTRRLGVPAPRGRRGTASRRRAPPLSLRLVVGRERRGMADAGHDGGEVSVGTPRASGLRDGARPTTPRRATAAADVVDVGRRRRVCRERRRRHGLRDGCRRVGAPPGGGAECVGNAGGASGLRDGCRRVGAPPMSGGGAECVGNASGASGLRDHDGDIDAAAASKRPQPPQAHGGAIVDARGKREKSSRARGKRRLCAVAAGADGHGRLEGGAGGGGGRRRRGARRQRGPDRSADGWADGGSGPMAGSAPRRGRVLSRPARLARRQRTAAQGRCEPPPRRGPHATGENAAGPAPRKHTGARLGVGDRDDGPWTDTAPACRRLVWWALRARGLALGESRGHCCGARATAMATARAVPSFPKATILVGISIPNESKKGGLFGFRWALASPTRP
ncbi:hypothetical protein BU14_0068s0014 [Porphyra umbilicalis]|uniref:Uncharacterized protein n=1 Tax=Porphyra umbilicalis TaxID=2786 RepID=A0A1X6PGJ9_PORUM|nr:hypothetical protein BU14_0068s0014 [Porphyra umbilicalis]|eukprot:OSX79918.1 hypothetical protein BU14_0068s0014 [Porphyra umbilicalis]